MDPLEKTFGIEEENIILGKDAKYSFGDRVKVCIKKISETGILIDVSEGEIISYEGKERYLPPGLRFVEVKDGKTTEGRTTSSDRDIGHRYKVKLSNGDLREFYQSDIYPEDTSQEYIFKNAFLKK